jgi:20S proteasome subunit alpha 3
MTADSNSLISYARNAAQSHLASYNEDIPVEQIVKRVCDLKQGYTQYGGARLPVFLYMAYADGGNIRAQVCGRLV